MHACLTNSFLQFYVAGKIGLYVNIASNIRIFCLFIEGVVFCFKVSEIFSVEKGLKYFSNFVSHCQDSG